MLKFIANKCVRPLLHRLGWDIVRLSNHPNLALDLKRFLPRVDFLAFDVGANLGQTVGHLKQSFPAAEIHAFEPSPSTFQQLKDNVSGYSRVKTWNVALGSKPGQASFIEYEHASMNSFLPLGERGWGTAQRKIAVEVTTLDAFCAQQQITHIDLLKSDTQGFDLEVFKGARGMLDAGGIDLIYLEVNFSDVYKGAPSHEEIFHFLNQYGFSLEGLYELHHCNQAIWVDALFVHQRLRSGSVAAVIPLG